MKAGPWKNSSTFGQRATFSGPIRINVRLVAVLSIKTTDRLRERRSMFASLLKALLNVPRGWTVHLPFASRPRATPKSILCALCTAMVTLE
jgi:hypothetical protein